MVRAVRSGGFLAALVLGLVVSAASLLGTFEGPELGVYDAWFKLRGAEDPGAEVVIVAIDDRSVERLGPPAWPRAVHAALLERLAGARVVGFDLVFDLPSDADNDSAFTEAVSLHQGVVLASMFLFEQDPDGTWHQQLVTPLPEFAAGAAGVGYVNMPADRGNTVRRVTVVDTNVFSLPYPSFGLAVTLTALGLDPETLRLEPGTLKMAGTAALPVNADYQTLINFWGPGRTFPTYSYADVLDGTVDPAVFAGRVVLIGDTTPLSRDYYENPFSRGNLVLSGGLPAPGVEIHAAAVQTYLTGRHFHRAPWAIDLTFLVLAGLATAVAARRSPWTGLPLAAVVAATVSTVAFVLWLKYHYWLSLAAPLVMVAAVYVGVTVENLVRTELERRRTRAMFGRYVSPVVVEQLMRESDVQLGGVKQEVTVLFSDIRGFTAFSEGKPPELVVTRLNEYFTAMTGCVFRHGGTLDKYLGDGLMAVFGAPLPVPDHARRAVAAAVDMQEQLAELNCRWAARGEPAQGIGVGINSGRVVVGNIGSPERMDYTVIGEAVNLAARLEALNKDYGTQVILSEHTFRLLAPGDVPAGWELRELGGAEVRGLAEPVRVYDLIQPDPETVPRVLEVKHM